MGLAAPVCARSRGPESAKAERGPGSYVFCMAGLNDKDSGGWVDDRTPHVTKRLPMQIRLSSRVRLAKSLP
eukprot:3389949-Pyramimonas_sp.AAC.1